MTTTAVELIDVNVSLRGKSVLEDINFEIFDKEFVAIIGPNGGGKTVLLKTILGLIKPVSGKVLVQGKDPRQARGIVGYVPQHSNFDVEFPISVLEATLMGRLKESKFFCGYSAKDREIALDALTQMHMLEFAERQIGKLSGGQLQRVLIARALTLKPQILLLDEPTSSLDTRIGRSVYELLEELSQQMTIVLVSHDIGVISRHVQAVACLNRRLHFHHSKEITKEMLETAYGCPVDLLAHGMAHRVLDTHHCED